MSPEQARGKLVDKRADIWAFGCVLYEMLTGRVAFAGLTISDTIAKILEREPDWSAAPRGDTRIHSTTPAPLPRERFEDASAGTSVTSTIEIDAIDEVLPGATATPGPLAPAKSRTTWLPWVALAADRCRRRHVGGPTPSNDRGEPARQRHVLARHELGGHGRAGRNLARRQVRRLPRRQTGQFDVWVSQLGTGDFDNLTPDIPPMVTPGNLLRSLGFSGDGIGDLVQSRAVIPREKKCSCR